MRLVTTNEGYAAIQGHGTRPVYVHRLVAYAHGLIDGLDDGREVHHVDPDLGPWVNSPENLQAVPPLEHATHHLQGEPLES